MVWEGLTLRRKIVALASGLVLISILFGGALIVPRVSSAVEAELGQRAMSVARTVAQVEEIRTSLGQPGGAAVIQPIAERMRLATGVEYIVLLDMRRIRYSHPLQERIGTRFEGGDEGPAFAEQAYISRAAGVNGPSIRAFVPVMSVDGNDQVGVVVVGILVPSLLEILGKFPLELVLALIGSLGVGLTGAWLLARHIKRQILDMEPQEIARLLEERVATFSAITEGIIAIDRDCRITVINEEAMRIAGLPTDANFLGANILDVIPYSRLPEVVKTGQGARNHQRLFGRTIILTNRLPIYHKGRIIGAIATFRDRTEITRLAEELTGLTKFIDAVRAQNHESLNKLHTIAGLIRLKKYGQALDYIFSITEQQQEITRFIARNIKDYRVSGLILGKVTRARELDVALEIDRHSRLDGIPAPLEANDLVIIIGNLIENAMDAVAEVPLGKRRVTLLIRGGSDGLEIRLEDNGCGLPSGPDWERIFDQGFSTKSGDNRGIGLALVKQLVDFARGRIETESEPGHTLFRIRLPGGGAYASSPAPNHPPNQDTAGG